LTEHGTVEGNVVLRCDGLTRRFGDRTAVDGVGFEVHAGETYGLLGPNGAGKTTTIRMVCGLLQRHGGTIEVAGEIVRDGDVTSHAHIGYVPQEVALYPDLTARENLRFFGRLYGLRGQVLRERVEEVLELVALVDRGDERIDTYSGGMKRRLNIGASLLHRPALLVLDEPTVGVDPQSRYAILTSVADFGATGMAILYTTHYMEEAERLCDRIGIIDHGNLVAQGTRRELVAFVEERDRVELTVSGDVEAFVAACREMPGVERVTVDDTGVHLLADDGHSLLPRVLEAVERTKVTLKSVDIVEPDLEAVFLHLTGTALRE
jgi:ABC-2 type transport system ATP-binding protein